MFISWQTYEGIKITVHSTIEIVKYLLSKGLSYVLTERLCQHPLEHYFGYNDNTIRTQQIFRPIVGHCINDDEQLNKIDLRPCLVIRRKKKKEVTNIDFKYVIYVAIFIATTI